MSILRAASTALKNALANNLTFYVADLITLTLQTGTVYRWTSWDQPLTVGGQLFAASRPWVTRGPWSVTNTMAVGSLELNIYSNMPNFASGPPLQTQIINGLFDGATFLLQRLFMPTPGDVSTWGTVDLFLGDCGAGTMLGAKAVIKVRSKSSRLDVMVPRNVYQPGCLHTFCDAGCTLNPATFTHSETAVSGSTRSIVAWSVSPSPTLGLLKGGTLTMTSGVANGQARSIIDVSTSQVTLAYPLIAAPASGDTFTVFQGCDKTLVSCGDYSNLANFRGFPFVPQPQTTSPQS